VHESLRELAETAADAADVSTAVEDLNAELEQLFRTQRRTIDTLQEQILRARRVNFGRLRPRLERIVRLTAADEGKLVELHFDNEDAEIDTQLLDSLTEPLQHLLKNAVVHGIETPEARRLLGKAETGSVTVQLDDRETHIEISVSDDGSGIAPEAIVEKAIRSGHLSPDAARGMNEQDRTNLIFTKGLTTAEKLDLNAGRGIGMSIVKERVESLGGSIGVRSLLYGGTRFSLRLPLKLALTNALIVGVGREKIAVPMKNIDRIVEFSATDIFARDADEFVEILGKHYLLRPLSKVLGWSEDAWDADRTITALIVSGPSTDWAVTVDNLIRSEEVVIKPLGPPLDVVPNLIGAAELSTGEAAAIVDLRGLLRANTAYAPLDLTPAARDQGRVVMVVDDSPSVRHMTGSVLSKAGLEVIAAKDGVDALEKLEHARNLPEVIFTDIEMPRLGGLELAARLKSSDAFSAIPVIVITSRSAEKHRELAKEAGVADYLTKPFADTDLIDAVNRHAGSNE
jgi:chemosensory pili system protein ChpA (sensor histidine kinase/response regulator)